MDSVIYISGTSGLKNKLIQDYLLSLFLLLGILIILLEYYI